MQPRLIVIREEVTACRDCPRRSQRGVYDTEWCSETGSEIYDIFTIPESCPLPEAPAPVEKRCGTCKKWTRREGRTSGDCGASLIVPAAFRAIGGFMTFTFETDGTDCPTWAAKEGL